MTQNCSPFSAETSVFRHVARKLKRFLRGLRQQTPEQVFTTYFHNNSWKGQASVSGTGSESEQTRKISAELPRLFREHHVATVLDIPCGDFHWMQQVDLSNISYLGADIVRELVDKNASLYARENVRFQKLDLITSALPKVDLIFCRDCLVHLSFRDITRALQNICDTHSTFLLTTTFTERTENNDILTGEWRPLALECAPFYFPKPIQIIVEDCTENGGIYRDKALALWKISDLAGICKQLHKSRCG